MKILLVIGAGAFLIGCGSGTDERVSAVDPGIERPGLNEEGEEQLERLLAIQNEPDQFRLAIEALIESKKKQTLFVLTHAMFELPYDSTVDFLPDDAPIAVVEGALDHLVVAEDPHDHLSARYWRALDGDGDREEAKAALLKWTIENSDRLVFFGDQLSFPELIEKWKLDNETQVP